MCSYTQNSLEFITDEKCALSGDTLYIYIYKTKILKKELILEKVYIYIRHRNDVNVEETT